VARTSHDPALLLERRQEGGAEPAGQVVALLAPVEAEPQERALALAAAYGIEVDPEPVQHRSGVGPEAVGVLRELRGEGVPAAAPGVGDPVVRDKCLGVEQRLGEPDAVAPGEVVVAGPRPAQRRGAGALAQRPDRQRRGQRGERLDHGCDLVGGEVVVAVPAGDLDPDQPGLGQLRELRAGRGCADAGLVGQHARRQRPAVTERAQDRRSGPVGEQARHGRDVRIATHLDVRLRRHHARHPALGTLPWQWKRGGSPSPLTSGSGRNARQR